MKKLWQWFLNKFVKHKMTFEEEVAWNQLDDLDTLGDFYNPEDYH